MQHGAQSEHEHMCVCAHDNALIAVDDMRGDHLTSVQRHSKRAEGAQVLQLVMGACNRFPW